MPHLPYATVKPHDPAECAQCSRMAAGHYVCQNEACPGRPENNGAGRPATHHTLRHATDQEYANLPLAHTPIDGIARQAVFACGDCAPLVGTMPTHRQDCPVFTDCQCTKDDPNPPRPPHPAHSINNGNGPDISRLLFGPEIAQQLLLHHGVHWWQVRRADSRYMQDQTPCLWAEIATLDDGGHLQFDDHGHEIRREVVIPIVAPPQGQLGQPTPADAHPHQP